MNINQLDPKDAQEEVAEQAAEATQETTDAPAEAKETEMEG